MFTNWSACTLLERHIAVPSIKHSLLASSELVLFVRTRRAWVVQYFVECGWKDIKWKNK